MGGEVQIGAVLPAGIRSSTDRRDARTPGGPGACAVPRAVERARACGRLEAQN